MASPRPENSTNVRLMMMAIAAADRVRPRLAAELALRAFLTPPRRRKRAPEEHRLLAAADGFAIAAAGAEVRVWSWGHGPAVLLVHGWGGRGTQLGALVEPLLERGRSVVTFDAPGHGASSGERATLAAMAETTRAVAERVGGVEAVIAHSFGAAATTAAISRGMGAKRVAYVAPLFGVLDGVGRFTTMLGLSAEARGYLHEELAAANLATAAELDGPLLAPRMTAPLLVVHDRDDKEVPFADGVAAAAVWPGARMVTTAGLGHQRILRDPDVVSALAEFTVGGAIGPSTIDERLRIERELANPDLRRVRA